MTDRALKLVMASLTYEKGDEENSTAVALEEYLLNDTIYIKMDGNWTVHEAARGSSSLVSAEHHGAAGQYVQSVRPHPDGIGDRGRPGLLQGPGKNGYERHAGQLSGGMASYMPMSSTNDTDLFRNMTLDVYYWITKDTHLLKKTDVHEVFTVDPQSLGLPAKGPCETGDAH